MEILQAIILGAVQGLSEFLPISSSAHLILLPWIFKWYDPGLGFDVALHMGTLVAVLAYFRKDLWHIVKGFFHSLVPATRDWNNIYQRLSWLLILASIPGAIIGKLLETYADQKFRNPLLIAITMLIGAGILFIVDRVGSKTKNLGAITKSNALGIGISQAFAIIPGISRSGATMIAGLFFGFKREDAAKFSFLMSVPIIFGAGLVKLDSFNVGVTNAQLLAGFVAAAVFGLLSIKFLLRYLSTNNNYNIFVWYRVFFAAVILLIYFL